MGDFLLLILRVWNRRISTRGRLSGILDRLLSGFGRRLVRVRWRLRLLMRRIYRLVFGALGR